MTAEGLVEVPVIIKRQRNRFNSLVKSSYECLMRKLKGLDECRLKIGVIVTLPIGFPIHKSKIMKRSRQWNYL